MHHVIIGAGPAAINAVETIREQDAGRSTITLVCDEPAHARMALPYWLAGSIPEAQTHTGDAAYFARLGVATRFGVRVVSIDPPGRTLALSDASTLGFDDLLIATGSSPCVRQSKVPTFRGWSRCGPSRTPVASCNAPTRCRQPDGRRAWCSSAQASSASSC
jgi:NAD(P)H-nitrite reductase large subunit